MVYVRYDEEKCVEGTMKIENKEMLLYSMNKAYDEFLKYNYHWQK